MLKRFIRYYKPHFALFVEDMLAALAVSLIGVVYPVITRVMLNELIPERRYRLIIAAGTGLFLLYVLRMLLDYFVQYKGHVMGVRMQADMRRDMFAKLQTLPFSFYDENETGKIMSRMTNDLMNISELAHHGPENVIVTGITVFVSFFYLASIDIWLTLIVFLCVPLLVCVALALRMRMRRAFQESSKAVAAINASLESSISGVRVTKAFTNAAREKEKFAESNRQFVTARTSAYKAMGQFLSATSFLSSVFNVVVLIAGGLFLYAGRIQFGDYSAFIVSVNLFLAPVTSLIGFMQQYQDGVAGFERFLEIMDAPSETNAPDARDVAAVRGHIRFENVSYRYDKGGNVLNDITLDIPEGETFALVGPSGGGKTTICHLIPHFYEINSGKIFIDEHEIHEITLDSLRRNIGIVQQDIYLFNASIKENILYGRLCATDEEVVEAAKRANIHDYILSLENGYDTQIGERGVRLSGGQKQRLSIARVFLKNPPILILDEATSALDNTTEILIQKSLDELCRGRTTLVVAHRLSTIKNADEIAVISNGRITERGTHQALIAQGGAYAKLYAEQFRNDSAISG